MPHCWSRHGQNPSLWSWVPVIALRAYWPVHTAPAESCVYTVSSMSLLAGQHGVFCPESLLSSSSGACWCSLFPSLLVPTTSPEFSSRLKEEGEQEVGREEPPKLPESSGWVPLLATGTLQQERHWYASELWELTAPAAHSQKGAGHDGNTTPHSGTALCKGSRGLYFISFFSFNLFFLYSHSLNLVFLSDIRAYGTERLCFSGWVFNYIPGLHLCLYCCLWVRPVHGSGAGVQMQALGDNSLPA